MSLCISFYRWLLLSPPLFPGRDLITLEGNLQSSLRPSAIRCYREDKCWIYFGAMGNAPLD